MIRNARGERRRYRKNSGRHVWMYSDINPDLRAEQVRRIIATAGLEQARLEAAAQADALALADREVHDV